MIWGFHYSDLFTSVPGIVGAIVGTIGLVLTAVFGKFKNFKLPYESAPGLSRGFLNFILFVPFLICFVFVTPTNAKMVLLIALLGIPLAGVAYLLFGSAFANHRYTRPMPAGWLFWKKVREDVIVGGTLLTPLAVARHQQGVPLQEMLASAEYKPDEIWERRSRTAIQQKIEIYYFLFFLCAISTVVAGALSVQALITCAAPLDSAITIWSEARPAKKS
jgi:hypothetical protein